MVQEYEKLINTWPSISLFLSPPSDDKDLDRLIDLSNFLIDQIKGDESHYLNGLLDNIGTLIFDYESKNIPEPVGDPGDCLQYLMEEHGLHQNDLRELGSPDDISKIISGDIELSKHQIKALSHRFGCSPAVFL